MRFVVFATQSYAYNAHRLAASAMYPGGFDSCRISSPKDFDPNERDRMLESERGAGYWFWKPSVILDSLEDIRDGEVVVYCDALYTWTKDAAPLVAKLLIDGIDIAMSPRKPRESAYTERDWVCPSVADHVFESHACDVGTREAILDSAQAWAGLVVVRKSTKSLEFLGRWRDLCCDAFHLRGNGFANHRHDQALISLLAKIESTCARIVECGHVLDESLANYRVPCNVAESPVRFDSRVDMVRSIVTPGSCIIEVGVFVGDFAAVLAELAYPNRLWLIDPFKGRLCSGDADGTNLRVVDGESAYGIVCDRFVDSNHVTIIRESSPSALDTHFEDGSVDVVYLDGDHTYEGCRADLDVAWRKLRRGGWLMGHDYMRNPDRNPYEYTFGVRRAVEEFCRLYGVRVSHVGLDGYVSFAIRR
jgi:Methyltransferase domain